MTSAPDALRLVRGADFREALMQISAENAFRDRPEVLAIARRLDRLPG